MSKEVYHCKVVCKLKITTFNIYLIEQAIFQSLLRKKTFKVFFFVTTVASYSSYYN